MKRRTLLKLGAPALVLAMLLPTASRGARRALSELTGVSNAQAAWPVQIIAPTRGPSVRPLDSARNRARVVRGSHLRAGLRDMAQLERGLWSAGEGGTAARDDRHPGLDAQYATAKANLKVAEANYRLALSTARRWRALAGTVAVSKQEVDVQVAGAAARQAGSRQRPRRSLAMRHSNLQRVVAPFDGVVTARLTDVGSYVNAAGGDLSVRASSTEPLPWRMCTSCACSWRSRRIMRIAW